MKVLQPGFAVKLLITLISGGFRNLWGKGNNFFQKDTKYRQMTAR